MTILIVMGVSGSGKTTLGHRLAERLGWPFQEGDDFHPAANVIKMSQGVPLTDEDRRPWLQALKQLIDNHIECGDSMVLTCSALKQAYRDTLKNGHDNVRFIYLQGSHDIILERVRHRHGHYMPVDLLQSQFDALEEPTDAICVDLEWSPERMASWDCSARRMSSERRTPSRTRRTRLNCPRSVTPPAREIARPMVTSGPNSYTEGAFTSPVTMTRKSGSMDTWGSCS